MTSAKKVVTPIGIKMIGCSTCTSSEVKHTLNRLPSTLEPIEMRVSKELTIATCRSLCKYAIGCSSCSYTLASPTIVEAERS